jgi:uncharacterized protein Veg
LISTRTKRCKIKSNRKQRIGKECKIKKKGKRKRKQEKAAPLKLHTHACCLTKNARKVSSPN